MLNDQKVNQVLRNNKIIIEDWMITKMTKIATIWVKGRFRGDGHALRVTADHLGYTEDNPLMIPGWGVDRDRDGKPVPYPIDDNVLHNIAQQLGVPKVAYSESLGCLEFVSPGARFDYDRVVRAIARYDHKDIKTHMGGLIPVGVSDDEDAGKLVFLPGSWLLTGFVDTGMLDLQRLIYRSHSGWYNAYIGQGEALRGYRAVRTREAALAKLQRLDAEIEQRLQEKRKTPVSITFVDADAWQLPLGKVLRKGAKCGVYFIVRSDFADPEQFRAVFEGTLGDGEFCVKAKDESRKWFSARIRLLRAA